MSGSRIVKRFDGPDVGLIGEMTARCARPAPVLADSVGDWSIDCLWRADRQAHGAIDDLHEAGFPQLARLIENHFVPVGLEFVRLFVTRSGGYVRPHRDWPAKAPKFTRYHVPIVTNSGCVNSEGEAIYRMAPGEIWYLDGSKPHSGISTAVRPRIHVVLDYTPQRDILAPLWSPRPDSTRRPLARRRKRLTPEQLSSIAHLTSIVSHRNQIQILDALGALHFGHHVACETIFDWLSAMVAKTGNQTAQERAARLRASYLW